MAEGYTDIGNQIIQNKLASVFEILDSFLDSYSYNEGLIGERELRRILVDHLQMTDS